jgi:hypothetical protein
MIRIWFRKNFEGINGSDDTMRIIREIEDKSLNSASSARPSYLITGESTDSDQIAYKFRLLFTKMTMFVCWITLFNILQPCGPENTWAIGYCDRFDTNNEEQVKADWTAPGKDCVKMNKNTIYLDKNTFIACNGSKKLYKSKNYRVLVTKLSRK